MLQSQTAVLERGALLEGQIETEPFEVAWASEGLWWVHFLEPANGVRVRAQAQISPDGINWIDHPTPAIEIAATGFASLPVEHFGHWMRLSVTTVTGSGTPRVRIYLALKG